jgi:hypothetical protein
MPLRGGPLGPAGLALVLLLVPCLGAATATLGTAFASLTLLRSETSNTKPGALPNLAL